MSDEGMQIAGHLMAGAAEQMRNAAGGIIHGADAMRNAASELASLLDHDRQQREEQLRRFETSVELQALAALLDFANSTGSAEYASKLGQKLDGLLTARGVL